MICFNSNEIEPRRTFNLHLPDVKDVEDFFKFFVGIVISPLEIVFLVP